MPVLQSQKYTHKVFYFMSRDLSASSIGFLTTASVFASLYHIYMLANSMFQIQLCFAVAVVQKPSVAQMPLFAD